MIVEHEVIEQIEDEPNGRPFPWICDLVRSLGLGQPFVLLQGMWRAGYVALVDQEGQALADWKCSDFFRARVESPEVQLVATTRGLELVYGR